MDEQGADAEEAGSEPPGAFPAVPGLVSGAGSAASAVPSDARGFADWLAEAGLGPELVMVLAGLDGRQRDEEVLLEGIAGWERVIAWASARQAELVSALAGLKDSSRHLEFVGDRHDHRPGRDVHVPRLPDPGLALRHRPHHPVRPEAQRQGADGGGQPARPVPSPPPAQDNHGRTIPGVPSPD